MAGADSNVPPPLHEMTRISPWRTMFRIASDSTVILTGSDGVLALALSVALAVRI
jgi:hypothetical protein